MREINTFALLIFGMLLVSCDVENELSQLPAMEESSEANTINLMFKSALGEMTNASAKSFDVYAYVKDTLVATTRGAVVENEQGEIELPLDEEVSLFAYANADQITLSDTLSKTQIHIGEQGQNEIYMSELALMVSDNSVDTVYFELNRIVGQMAFQPVEDEATLNAINQFDAIDVVFINAGVSYLPNSNTSIQDIVTIRTTKAEGFKAEIYSFPTFGGNYGTVEVIYYKEGEVVNKTIRALDVAINVEASKRSEVLMPLLDENYLDGVFNKSSSNKRSLMAEKITLKEYHF